VWSTTPARATLEAFAAIGGGATITTLKGAGNAGITWPLSPVGAAFGYRLYATPGLVMFGLGAGLSVSFLAATPDGSGAAGGLARPG